MVVTKRLWNLKGSVTFDTNRNLIQDLHDDVIQFLDDLITPTKKILASNKVGKHDKEECICLKFFPYQTLCH
jgi:hypothetical protein